MKKSSKKTPVLLVLLTLSIALLFSLSSCEAGSDEILTKAELLANVSGEENTELEYVWDYLDRWDFPAFSGGKLKRVENLYRTKYYKEIPAAYELALAVADTFIEKDYDKIDLSDSEKVTDSVISAYVLAIGDPYSFYRTSEQYQKYTGNMSGTFVGIGVRVVYSKAEDTITVTEPIKNSPAEAAGILEGDIIVAVDGERTAQIGYDMALEKISGEKGTYVTVTVKRGGEELDFRIKRAAVVDSSVDYYINEDKIGYIDINSFKANTDELFAEAIDYMKENGALAIIYDVRDNGGGYLESVVNMLDYIAPDGMTLASFSNDYDDAYIADDGHSFFLPTVIICNGMSASASELFLAGMRDIGALGHFDITVVGEKTYGKGVMQTSYRLSDKSAITLTVAYYYPPSAKNFDGEGIHPTVKVTGAAAQRREAFSYAGLMISK